MELSFLVNGVTLQPGAMTPDDKLRQAGLAPISRWQRLVRRLPSHQGCWEADDPHVECFGGEVSIYPCRHDISTVIAAGAPAARSGPGART